MTAAGSDERRDTWREDVVLLGRVLDEACIASECRAVLDELDECEAERRAAEEALARVAGELERLSGRVYALESSFPENFLATLEAAEQEVTRLRDGLREWLEDVDDALSDNPSGHDAYMRIGARWHDHDARLRSLLSGGQAEQASTRHSDQARPEADQKDS